MPHRIRTLFIVLFVAATVGCASSPETSETAAADQAADAPVRTPKDPADTDPRYALPKAKSRSLTIYLGTQTFEYVEDDQVIASGEVSSGSAEHPTPQGNFLVQSKQKNKRSGSYTNYFNQNTPMPYALQFHGPYYVHEGWLPGHADSHGCVRLSYENAHFVFSRMSVGDPVRIKPQGTARQPNPWPDLFPVF